MRLKKHLILILATSFLGGNTFSQNSFSIEEATDFALKNNTKIKNSDLDIEKANQKVKETRAIGLPQVNAEGSFNHFLDIATTVMPANAFNPLAPADAVAELQFGTEFNTSASVTVSQLLFNGSYLVGLQTAKKYKGVSAIQKKKSEQDVKEGVLKAYYSVLVSQESITTLEEMLKTTTKIYDETKLVFKQGLIEEDNVDQLSLSVLNTKNALSSSKRQLETAKDYLKYEMGYDLTSPISVTTDFEGLINVLSAADIKAESDASNNLDYQLLSQQIELSMLNVKYEKSRSLPSLSAFFNHQQTAMRNEFDVFANKAWYPTTLWGLKLSIPIWSSGQSGALKNQAKIELKKSENQLKVLEDGLTIQMRSATSSFNNAYDSYLSQKEGVDISKKIYGKYQIKFKEGIISSMELTQSQGQYLNAQTSYIKAMFDLINAKVQLDKLTNKL
jgi:outer membrane protein TolC